MYKCIVCKTTSEMKKKENSNLSFHSFPKNALLKRQWIASLELQQCKVFVSSKVCSDHFIEDDFIDNRKGGGLRVLKKGRIPSIKKNVQLHENQDAGVHDLAVQQPRCLIIDCNIFSNSLNNQDEEDLLQLNATTNCQTSGESLNGCVTELSKESSDPQILEGVEILRNLDLFESKFLDIPNDFIPQFPELLESFPVNSRSSGNDLNLMEIANQDVAAELCIGENQNDYEVMLDGFVINSGDKLSTITQGELFIAPTLEATQAYVKAFKEQETLTEVTKPYFKSVKSLFLDNNVMTEVCRICFQSLEAEDEVIKLYEPSLQQDSVQIKRMLKLVLPDLDLEIYRDNAICTKCGELLVFSYQLKEKWLSTEERLHDMIERKKDVIQKDTDLVIIGKRKQNKTIQSSTLLDHDYTIPTSLSESTLPGSVDVPHKTTEENLREESSDQKNVIESTKAKPVQRLTHKPKRQVWGSGPYMCEECGLIFTHIKMFRHHLTIHSKTKEKESLTMCEICGHLCANMKTHMQTHSEFKCTKCKKVFSSESWLHRHIARGHPQRSWQCHICGLQLRYKTSLKPHLKQHNPANKTIACHLCDRKFFYRTGLQKHVATHSSLKLYTCPYCGKFLKHWRSLEIHTKIYHLNKAKNVCEFCNKVYWKKCDLHKHRLRVHSSQASSKLPNEETLAVKNVEISTSEN